ncbi:MAG: TetR/AcrR family transcriptional regulator [Ruminococcus sp.]|nr:TetR/AcrR family transcriptional regulator [Ruminococcus sp.]
MDYKNFIKNAKNDRINDVISITAKMLLETDVSEIKMTDIADRCEIGVASLYRYFGTKAGLVIKAGALLWGEVMALFDGVFDCDYYKEKTGLEKIRELMKVFKVLFISHGDFLRFVDSFDRYITKETVSDEDMALYQKSVTDFYPLFESAYNEGVKDGSLKAGVDFEIMYLSLTHALLLMSEKFSMGSIFKKETELAECELDFMINMAIEYIKA